MDYDHASAESLVAAQPSGDVPAPGEWMQLAIRASGLRPVAAALFSDVAVGADAVQPRTFERECYALLRREWLAATSD